MLLTLLALSAPGLALAPLQAIEPVRHVPPLQEASWSPRPAPSVPGLVPVDGGIIVEPAVGRFAADGPRYQAALDEARARARSFGVTFAVVRDGELVWAGASGTTRDGGPMTPDTPLVIGSVTKTFVAAAVLQLVSEGRIDLDDPVRRHLPRLRAIDRSITVGQLLEHTSGLADLFNEQTRIGLETDDGRSWSADEIFDTLEAAWWDPGAGWGYSNTNYLVLALLVEELSGMPLEQVIDDRFAAPLGLDSAAVLDGAAGGALAPAWASIFRGSGAMVASAADLARWGDALYAGSVLAPAERRAMLSTNADDYGLGVQRHEISGFVGYGHSGLLNTDTTLLLHLPERDVTIALLVNRTRPDMVEMLLAHPAPGEPSLLELAIRR